MIVPFPGTSHRAPKPKIEFVCDRCDDLFFVEADRLGDKLRFECPDCGKSWTRTTAGAVRGECNGCCQYCGVTTLALADCEDVLVEKVWIPLGFENAVLKTYGVPGPLADAEHLPLWLVEECVRIHVSEAELKWNEDTTEVQADIDEAMNWIAEHLGPPDTVLH